MQHCNHHAGACRRDLTRAVLAAGGLFLLWRAARGLKSLAWIAFGLGVAGYWTGVWPW